MWAGVEMADPSFGLMDGSVDGRQYFDCEKGAGLFVRPERLAPVTPPLPSLPTAPPRPPARDRAPLACTG